MSADRYIRRREKLIRGLRAPGVEALLVTSVTNVKYLTGFSGDSSYLLLGPEITLLLSDTRYETQISEECPGLDAYIRSNREPMIAATSKAVRKAKLRALGVEAEHVTIAAGQSLSELLEGVEIVATTGLVEEMRAIKDAAEIAEIRNAVEMAQRGFELLRASLLSQMTEREAAHDLEHAMRRFGATDAGFDSIVAVGPRAALPHARPGTAQLSDSDFVLIDWGARTPSGYCSDLTRVLVTGKLSPKLKRIYEVVFEAQRRGIAAIRPGARCCDVDAAARSYIEDAGFGKQFGHGLGHSIGLDVHEFPRLSPIQEDELKPGMILTVEPGIYLPGWGGVRIEDDVLVTRDGHEVLTSVPKELDQVLVH